MRKIYAWSGFLFQWELPVGQEKRKHICCIKPGVKYRVFKKKLYNVFQMLLCGECYENVYT
jgi:hypothetical protein